MDVIDGLRAFVATAQTGSFTAAADQLGISNRLTSKYVAELENRLGVRLLQRTTRQVGLTPSGEDLLARAPALLNDLDDVLSSLSEGAKRISGLVRISAPTTFGEVYVTGMLARFSHMYPDIRVDLRLDDKYVDLASEGIDLAFRLGTADTVSVKVRKLGEMMTYLVASPNYLSEFGHPSDLDELSNHICIVDTNRRTPRRWPLYENGVEHIATVNGRLSVNSARAVRELAVAGMGIAYSPHFAVSKDLASGRLLRVMNRYCGKTNPVSAVYLEGRSLPNKIRALIEFAAKDIKTADVF